MFFHTCIIQWWCLKTISTSSQNSTFSLMLYLRLPSSAVLCWLDVYRQSHHQIIFIVNYIIVPIIIVTITIPDLTVDADLVWVICFLKLCWIIWWFFLCSPFDDWLLLYNCIFVYSFDREVSFLLLFDDLLYHCIAVVIYRRLMAPVLSSDHCYFYVDYWRLLELSACSLWHLYIVCIVCVPKRLCIEIDYLCWLSISNRRYLILQPYCLIVWFFLGRSYS